MPFTDKELETVPYYRPDEDSAELRYMREQREKLGGYMPVRRRHASNKLTIPKLEFFESFLEGSGDREISTTMAFVRMLSTLVKDKSIGDRVVPIVPDEARTFGMEGLFRQMDYHQVQRHRELQQHMIEQRQAMISEERFRQAKEAELEKQAKVKANIE